MHIKEAVKNIREKKLEQMKENFNSAITEKAVQKLEEKKIDIAKNYFGQK
jgi:ribosome recycling factor